MTMGVIPADQRLRLLAALALAAAVSQLRHPGPAAAALGLALVLALAARMPGALWRRVLHVEGFVLLLLLTVPFAVPGEALARLGPLVLTDAGLARAALLALKVSAAAILVLAILGPAEPIRLAAALQSLRVPEPLVRVLLLSLRYLSLIREEARRLHDAMRLRGFRPGTNRHTWRSYGNLIGMLLVRALDRAERIDEAMRCRGFAGRFPHAAAPAPGLRDWAAFALLLGLGAACLLGDRA